jgi:outer membrane protein OmpA-like peptidoglycan-associated protein
MRYFVSLFLGVVLSSCTSTTATKPDRTSSSTPAPQAQPGKPVLPARQSTSSSPSTSSLDAHREGTAPANGPMNEIYFGFDKYDLRADARTAL